ncbi:NTPase [Candidatus Poribacteria bacterium]
MREAKKHKPVKNILITGNPGVGKTTLIRSIISKLNISAGGFYTAEVRDENGKRWGFKIISLDGQEDVLASVDIISPHRVGKYCVNAEAMDRVGVPAVRNALKDDEVIVIDEIGRMELTSKRFRDVVAQALDSRKPVLGTIAIKNTHFTKKAREREDTRVIRLTRANLLEVETYVERLLGRTRIGR